MVKSYRVPVRKDWPRTALAASAGVMVLSLAWSPSVAASGVKSSPGVTFRAVLCFAPAFTNTRSSSSSTAGSQKLPPCASSYRLNAKNLNVKPVANAAGYTNRTIGPDPAFRSEVDTPIAKIRLTSAVLLPAIKGSGMHERYVLGPAQMTSTSIQSATVVKSTIGEWIVEYQLTPSGGRLWDSLAK